MVVVVVVGAKGEGCPNRIWCGNRSTGAVSHIWLLEYYSGGCIPHLNTLPLIHSPSMKYSCGATLQQKSCNRGCKHFTSLIMWYECEMDNGEGWIAEMKKYTRKCIQPLTLIIIIEPNGKLTYSCITFATHWQRSKHNWVLCITNNIEFL